MFQTTNQLWKFETNLANYGAASCRSNSEPPFFLAFAFTFAFALGFGFLGVNTVHQWTSNMPRKPWFSMGHSTDLEA